MSRLRTSLPLLLLPLACAPEHAFPVDPGEPIVHGESDGRMTEVWVSSTRSIALAPVDEALCFLSGVTGRFDKNSDEASVGVQGDRWVVTAATGRSCRLEHPIGAAATCVRRPPGVSGRITSRVESDGGGTRSESIEGEAVLAGVYGKWRGLGEGARIDGGALVVSNAHVHEPFVAAAAMALGLPAGSLGPEFIAEANAGPVDLEGTATHVCLLTRVEGDFWVAADGVRLFVRNDRWSLEVRSGSHEGAGWLDRPLRAGARCFAR